LIILLDNAVKYSTDVKQVEVFAWINEQNEVAISVKDHGEGIKKEEQSKIFDRFYRIDKARTNSKGGNGLGLSIACEIISVYKGQITVESKEGQGTTFTITLPKVM
jgi:signal transduction histidine kinase